MAKPDDLLRMQNFREQDNKFAESTQRPFWKERIVQLLSKTWGWSPDQSPVPGKNKENPEVKFP